MRAFICLLLLMFISQLVYGEGKKSRKIKRESVAVTQKFGALISSNTHLYSEYGEHPCLKKKERLYEITTGAKIQQDSQGREQNEIADKALLSWLRDTRKAIDQLASCLRRNTDCCAPY